MPRHKILNIRDIHTQMHGKDQRPTDDTVHAAYEAAYKHRILIGPDGRCYVPWKPNVKGMRYEKGHLVPRRA